MVDAFEYQANEAVTQDPAMLQELTGEKQWLKFQLT